jgi:hypothetical protein
VLSAVAAVAAVVSQAAQYTAGSLDRRNIMAAFGSGLGPDPRAAIRAQQLAEASKVRQRNIENLGQGRNAFEKGATALSVVAGEHIGSALAGAFGMEQPVSPEMEAANAEAKLLENINMIEGDPASSQYAKQAARAAMDAGRQDIAFQFMQEAGNREKAETALGVKTEAARLKTLQENYGRQPNSMKLSLIAGGNEDVFQALNIPPGPERDALIKSAAETQESNLIRAKAKAAEVRRTLDTAVNATDITSTLAWMESASIGAEGGMLATEEDLEGTNKAIAMRIAADANQLMVSAQESGAGSMSQADANEQAAAALIESGAFEVNVGEGTSMFGMRGQPEGFRSVTGFGPALIPDKKEKETGKKKRSVQL